MTRRLRNHLRVKKRIRLNHSGSCKPPTSVGFKIRSKINYATSSYCDVNACLNKLVKAMIKILTSCCYVTNGREAILGEGIFVGRFVFFCFFLSSFPYFSPPLYLFMPILYLLIRLSKHLSLEL